MNSITSRWRPLLAALVGFGFLGIVAFTVHDVLADRNLKLTAAATNQTVTANALSIVMSMSVDGLSSHVHAAAELMQRRELPRAGEDPRKAFDQARLPLNHHAFVSSLLIDTAGRVLLDGRKGQDTDLSAEAVASALRYHKAHSDDVSTHVGFPRTVASDPSGVLAFSRGVFDASGSLRAVLLVNAKLKGLRSVYEQINDVRGPLSFTLLGPDGQRFTWAPEGEASAAAMEEPAFSTATPAADTGFFEYLSAASGESSRYSYAKVESTPAVVLIGASTRQVLSAWRKQTVLEAAIALLCSAVMVLLSLLVSRAVGALQVERGRIAAQNTVLQARVRYVNDNLRDATDELDALSDLVPQQLSDPVQKARGYLDMAIADPQAADSPVLSSLLKRAQASVRNMAHAINNVDTLTRVSRDLLDLQLCDVTTMVHQAADQMRRSHPDRKVSLNVEGNMLVVADRAMLQILFDRLISNAWKFTVDAPVAEVDVGRVKVEGVMYFFVRDNGVGVDADKAASLFRPAEGDDERTEVNGGGLGLATVDRIARRHGGRVWAESHASGGVTFWFSLEDERSWAHEGQRQPSSNPLLV